MVTDHNDIHESSDELSDELSDQLSDQLSGESPDPTRRLKPVREAEDRDSDSQAARRDELRRFNLALSLADTREEVGSQAESEPYASSGFSAVPVYISEPDRQRGQAPGDGPPGRVRRVRPSCTRARRLVNIS